jgi:hypothetical protein
MPSSTWGRASAFWPNHAARCARTGCATAWPSCPSTRASRTLARARRCARRRPPSSMPRRARRTTRARAGSRARRHQGRRRRPRRRAATAAAATDPSVTDPVGFRELLGPPIVALFDRGVRDLQRRDLEVISRGGASSTAHSQTTGCIFAPTSDAHGLDALASEASQRAGEAMAGTSSSDGPWSLEASVTYGTLVRDPRSFASLRELAT